MTILATLLTLPVRGYRRWISPVLPARCRYSPSCSSYALTALRVHGAIKGTLLTIWRLLRCNPWSKGGVDQVPAHGHWPSHPLGYDELLALYAEEDSPGTPGVCQARDSGEYRHLSAEPKNQVAHERKRQRT